MPERDWQTDWELANTPWWRIDWCHVGSPEKLQQALRYWLMHYKVSERERHKLASRMQHLEALCAAMRRVLEFYARAANYFSPSQMAGQTEHSLIEIDLGQRARDILAELDKKETLTDA